jgi:hypothetical protein
MIKLTLTDKINFGLIAVTASAVLWMFTTFASASEVEQIKLDIAYGQYYDRLDDYEEALSEGRVGLAAEYKRQMERLRAIICEEDPKWERCENGN